MRQNVIKFMEKIADGDDVMVAANETGVIEMNTQDLLETLSVVLGGKRFSNQIKCMYKKFSDWIEATQELLNDKKSLEDVLNSINELDKTLKDLNK